MDTGVQNSLTLHVLHLITGLNTGGAETVLCRLLKALPPPAFEHTVISLLPEGALSAQVIKVATLRHMGMRRGRATPADLWRLRRLMRASRPDVVQGWMYHANVLASVAAVGTGVPVVWGIRQSLHDYASNGFTTRMAIRAGQYGSRAPTAILYNSTASAEQHRALGYFSRHAQVIPNGFDAGVLVPDAVDRTRVRTELSIPEDAIAIGLVARVHPMKDHANFLHAAALLVRWHSSTVFILVGDGTEPVRFVENPLVDELGLRVHLRLCGRRTDVAAIDNGLDIASSSSYGEAFPNAIAEAMACGTPCVATDVGDVREIIGDTGVVVPPRDPEALAAGWAKLIEMGREQRHALGLRARARIVEHYSLDAMAQRYAALYRSLAKGATGING